MPGVPPGRDICDPWLMFLPRFGKPSGSVIGGGKKASKPTLTTTKFQHSETALCN
jgi:hypothetical protein